MANTAIKKIWRAFLGIATEIVMTCVIMAFALGLAWLISHK